MVNLSQTETKRMANEHQSAMSSNIVIQAIEMGFSRDEISQIIKRYIYSMFDSKVVKYNTQKHLHNLVIYTYI